MNIHCCIFSASRLTGGRKGSTSMVANTTTLTTLRTIDFTATASPYPWRMI